MTAVIYARYSSDSQREASIEGQLRDCKDYAEKNGITVVGTYIDRAYSAKTDDRPDFQRMIKDSAKKIFDVVLVWKLDRFARNRFDAVNTTVMHAYTRISDEMQEKQEIYNYVTELTLQLKQRSGEK